MTPVAPHSPCVTTLGAHQTHANTNCDLAVLFAVFAVINGSIQND